MVNVYDMNIWQDTDGTARKPSGISAAAPKPEYFPDGQKVSADLQPSVR